MRNISICIPTWNRYEMTLECFSKVHHVKEVTEVVIVDDCSTNGAYEKLQEYAKDNPKIKLFKNEKNIDCYRNKHRSIELATNNWCCLWDSDNIFGFDYLTRIFQMQQWENDTIYTPCFAEPSFSFKQFSGLLITRHNIHRWIDEPMFEVMLNACNYFVNRNEYLKVWDGGVDPVTSDSIYVVSKWLEAGNKIQVVGDMVYHHRIHNDGHYNNNVHRTQPGFHESILHKLRSMI